jgi:HPt (histidine-containing phosphotransfer) domain-containing protein
LGFDDHLCKPIRRSQTVAMLSQHARLQAPQDADAAAIPGGAPAVLDPAALARLAELDPKGESRLLERVLRAFQTSAARLSPQLATARAGADRATIRLVAHTLKSSSASIGALHLSQLCAQVEAAIRVDTGADLTLELDALGRALDAALLAIAALLKEDV